MQIKKEENKNGIDGMLFVMQCNALHCTVDVNNNEDAGCVGYWVKIKKLKIKKQRKHIENTTRPFI